MNKFPVSHVLKRQVVLEHPRIGGFTFAVLRPFCLVEVAQFVTIRHTEAIGYPTDATVGYLAVDKFRPAALPVAAKDQILAAERHFIAGDVVVVLLKLQERR